MIEALAELDENLPGLGLYASDEFKAPAGRVYAAWKVEWELALLPLLNNLDCIVDHRPEFGRTRLHGLNQKRCLSIRFMTSATQICDLHLIRTSAFKDFRLKHGSQMYRTYGFAEAWSQLKMAEQIKQLWWPRRHESQSNIRMILFVGFDQYRKPFYPELAQLEKDTAWKNRQITYQSQSWPDSHGRDFNVLVGCWSLPERKI